MEASSFYFSISQTVRLILKRMNFEQWVLSSPNRKPDACLLIRLPAQEICIFLLKIYHALGDLSQQNTRMLKFPYCSSQPMWASVVEEPDGFGADSCLILDGTAMKNSCNQLLWKKRLKGLLFKKCHMDI